MAVNDFFNAEWYLNNNPDVREAVEAGLVDAKTHFELHGRFEGRSPSPAFDPAYYLEKNPDVKAAVDQGLVTAYDHFLLHGQSEARAFVPFFDANFYLENNADVRDAVGEDAGMAVAHFLLHGQGETRAVSPFFDLNAYLDANPDVKDAVNQTDASALEHLLIHGFAEGRPLGNGISLAQFANDPVFQDAANPFEALARVAEVAPFMPSFEPPADWEAPAETPIPQDFVPVEGEHLVVPPTVEVPDDTELPDAFEPVDDAPGDGGGDTDPGDPGTPTFTVDVQDGQLIFGGSDVSGDISIIVAANGNITASRSGVTAENTGISIEGITGASVDRDQIQVDMSAVAEHVAAGELTAEDLSYLGSVLRGAQAISDDVTIAEGVEASELQELRANIDALADGRDGALLNDVNNNEYTTFSELYSVLKPLTDFRMEVEEVVDGANTGELTRENLQEVVNALVDLGTLTVNNAPANDQAERAQVAVDALMELDSNRWDALVTDLAANGDYSSFEAMLEDLAPLAVFRVSIQRVMDDINNEIPTTLNLEALQGVADGLTALVGKTVNGEPVTEQDAEAAVNAVAALRLLEEEDPGAFQTLEDKLGEEVPYSSFRDMTEKLQSLLEAETPGTVEQSFDGADTLFIVDGDESAGVLDYSMNSELEATWFDSGQNVYESPDGFSSESHSEPLVTSDPLIALSGVADTSSTDVIL